MAQASSPSDTQLQQAARGSNDDATTSSDSICQYWLAGRGCRGWIRPGPGRNLCALEHPLMHNGIQIWKWNVCRHNLRGQCKYGEETCCRFHASSWPDVVEKYWYLFRGPRGWSTSDPLEVAFQESFPQHTRHWPRPGLEAVLEDVPSTVEEVRGSRIRAFDCDRTEPVRLLVCRGEQCMLVVRKLPMHGFVKQ